MTPVQQARPTAIIASPQAQMVLQPQSQQQQMVAANKLTSAANSLLQLQQQQILMANGSPVVNLCNSIQNQSFLSTSNGNLSNNGSGSSSKSYNGDNNENVNQQHSIAGPFKVYSELKNLFFSECEFFLFKNKKFLYSVSVWSSFFNKWEFFFTSK